MTATCKARLLSDLTGQTSCDKAVASLDGRLCAFHARQCQALYRGYKRRNAQLDALSEAAPSYLAENKTSLVVQEFKDVETEALFRELHGHLFKKYNLLDRVIRARRLHHNHFFAVDNDYGHEKYLTKLQNEKHVVTRALERLGKRAAQVMYKNQQWLDWVQACQTDEEKRRDNEARKIKLEALLFKRHQKEVERHQREVQAREEKKRQEAFLDELYHQRLAEMSEEAQDSWDPVQDVFDDERESYLDLIRYFLMVKDQDITEGPSGSEPPALLPNPNEYKEPEKELSKSAKKRAKKLVKGTNGQSGPDGRGPDTIEMETKSQMRQRLREPVACERSGGWYLSGSEGYMSVDSKVPGIPDEELNVLLDEVAEIKALLFCRLLLSQASLLPMALQANSIDEFLENDQVTQENLRDLCLKLERPKLQDVRDACADFVRGEEAEEEDEKAEEPTGEDEDEDNDDDYYIPQEYRPYRFRKVPDKYQTKREKHKQNKYMQKRGLATSKEGQDVGKRVRIKVCGRYMYNYPSEKSLGRGGWFHFAVIAKDSDLYDAIELCRNWNEFFELNILCTRLYFPAPKWMVWVGDLLRQQFLTLGFIPYFFSDKASKLSHYFQSGSRGMARRAHQVLEVRNFICGHIKRDDAATRRFIKYLSLETSTLIALVRDPKTGRTLIQPPDEELWIVREKSGWGRASKNEYEILESVGTSFFERMDALRKWHFSFDEYYDVYIWDANPGRNYFLLQRNVEDLLMKSLRVRSFQDCFKLAEPILKTLTKDPVTERVRSIRPGEEVGTLWAEIKPDHPVLQWSPDTGEASPQPMPTFKYTEADEIEDVYLFPEEVAGTLKNNLFKKNLNAMEKFESRPPIDIRRFAEDLDTDDSLEEGDEDMDDEWESTDTSEDEDNMELYELKPTSVPHNDVHKAIDILEKKFRAASMNMFQKPDYFIPLLKDRNAGWASQLPVSVRNSPEDLMGSIRFSLMDQKEYDPSHNSLEKDFFRHIDREKSKIFKQCFHMGDFEPGKQAKWVEMKFLIMKMDDYLMHRFTTGPFELMAFLDLVDMIQEERRIVTDVFDAYAAVSLFFDGKAFFDSNHAQRSNPDTLLLNQAERAKHLPDRKTQKSNKLQSKDMWSEWDGMLASSGIERYEASLANIYPMEWAKVVRPTIIRLYKAGLITPSYFPSPSGIAIAHAEPSRPLDMYIDYRENIPAMKARSHLIDPTPFTPSYLLKKARSFAQEHPTARFAALRLWSAPHFWPFMFASNTRNFCNFIDDRGRMWEWRFIPKDMPFAEWSVHYGVSSRFEQWKKKFGNRIIVARDLVLVMGTDAEDLRGLAAAATFAIQTRPWRLEVDFWRSFVNVDLGFLEGLDERWLE